MHLVVPWTMAVFCQKLWHVCGLSVVRTHCLDLFVCGCTMILYLIYHIQCNTINLHLRCTRLPPFMHGYPVVHKYRCLPKSVCTYVYSVHLQYVILKDEMWSTVVCNMRSPLSYTKCVTHCLHLLLLIQYSVWSWDEPLLQYMNIQARCNTITCLASRLATIPIFLGLYVFFIYRNAGDPAV